MTKNLLVILCLMVALWANAITYTYGEFNSSARTCTLTGWGGQQPSSGKLVLKETYEKDGVTYKVTAIAPHALDNLTTVTEITIPANVVRIGEVDDIHVDETGNFFNCPKLALFKVAAGSSAFAASGAGLLMYKGSNIIVRVPPAITFSSGTTLKMSKTIEAICKDAFAGNSTITNIALSPNIVLFVEDCGFSDMTALKEFSINGTEKPHDFSVVDGVLYDAQQERLISYPPCRTAYSFTIPSSVGWIKERAFRNTVNLYEVALNRVHTIGVEAFANSAITKLSIPSEVYKIDRGAFSGLTRLQEMTINGCRHLPEDFARGSKLLAKVNLPEGVRYIDNNAFKDCPRLASFPFTADNVYGGDSIFSGCGFKEVVFRKGVMSKDGMEIGDATFAGNKELSIVDMSKIEVARDGKGCEIPVSFVADCPKLRSFLFPKLSSFWSAMNELNPNFGINSPVEYIFLGAFYLGKGPALYYDSGTHMPTVYMQTTDAPRKSWPLNVFFATAGGAVCKPRIYCEGYTMAHEERSAEYVYPGAIYFVPGGTLGNYQAASSEGCDVMEMYSYQVINSAGMLRLRLIPKIDGLVFTGVSVNNGEISVGTPDADGNLMTDMVYDLVDNITVEYNLRGARMKTFYPDKPNMSGVDEIDNPGSSFAITVAGTNVMFGEEARYQVADLSGRIVIAGSSDVADLSSLPCGIYVVSAIGCDGTAAVKKISIGNTHR